MAEIGSEAELVARFFPEHYATNPCRRCDRPESEHRGLEKFCPIYATFQPLSGTREPEEGK